MFLMMKYTKPNPAMILTLSVVISINSKNWWSYWVLMEINTVGFIILTTLEMKKEKMMVFFLMQTMASIMLISFIFTMNWANQEEHLVNMWKIFLLAMFFKMGMFPFQNWLIKIVKMFSWKNLFILLTWQKLIPIFMVMKLKMNFKLITMLTLMLILTTTLMTKHTLMKNLMVISSISHNSWMIFPMKMFKMATIFYLTVYSIIIYPLIKLLSKKPSSLSEMFQKNSKMESMFMFISITGMPPSMGFVVKMMSLVVLFKMMTPKLNFVGIFLGACLGFFVYFKMFYKKFFMNKNSIKKMILMEKTNKFKAMWALFAVPMVLWK